MFIQYLCVLYRLRMIRYCIFLTLFKISFTNNFYFQTDLRKTNSIKFMQYYGTITLLFVTKKQINNIYSVLETYINFSNRVSKTYQFMLLEFAIKIKLHKTYLAQSVVDDKIAAVHLRPKLYELLQSGISQRYVRWQFHLVERARYYL